jgi:hypothetical protein
LALQQRKVCFLAWAEFSVLWKKFHCDQGDQMSLRRSRRKCSPSHFLSKLIENRELWKKEAQNVALLSQYKKLSKENNRPIGENSPNLVTLFDNFLPNCFAINPTALSPGLQSSKHLQLVVSIGHNRPH